MAERAPWPHTGAVLAGGRSRRMGRDKAALRLPDGRTMLETVCGAVAAVCRDVVVVGGPAGKQRRLEDLRAGAGPLGGLEALLAAGLDTEYLVCPCDVPAVTPELLARLLWPGHAAATVFRVAGERRIRPLPARLAAEALGAVRRQLDAGRRAVRDLVEMLEPEIVPLTADEAAALLNVNTIEDLARVSARARRPS